MFNEDRPDFALEEFELIRSGVGGRRFNSEGRKEERGEQACTETTNHTLDISRINESCKQDGN